MITVNTEEFKNGNLTAEQNKATREMIEVASDEGTASSGKELHTSF